MAGHLDDTADEGVLRQHCELDVPRDLQVVLQRQPVGHLQEHQQVDQREAAEQPEGAVGPDRTREPDSEEERDQRKAHHPQPLVQLEHADERADQRETEQRQTRRRQPGGERDEEEPASHEEPAVPGEPAEDLRVAMPRAK